MSSSDVYVGPLVEFGPPYDPQIEPPGPDTRIALLLASLPPNTMATGNPKDYTKTETADTPEAGDDYPAAITPSDNSASSSSSSSAASASSSSSSSSAVSVAEMAESSGSVANAANDISSAATSAMSDKAASMISESSAKALALPATIPGKISQIAAERFGKAKGDKDKYGVEYDPVKLSVGDVLSEISVNATSLLEQKDKENDEKRANKKMDEITKDTQKAIAKTNELIAKSAKVISEISTHVLEGADWLQQNINKEMARLEQNVTQELNTTYIKVETEVNRFCENEGNAIGARMVGEYNKLITKQAKKIYDDKKKLERKAKIISDALIHKAKLQIFAILGL